jgi:hypothetical protein
VWEQESEVDIVMEAGGRDGEGVTRGQEGRMRENSQEHLGPKEFNPFKLELAPPNQVILATVARLFRLLSRSRPRLVSQGRGLRA